MRMAKKERRFPIASLYKHIKRRYFWEYLDPGTLLNYYRYSSLLITTIFYLVGPPAAPIYLKLGVSVCLLLEAYVFIGIYSRVEDGTRKLLILIETVGLASILILTGGMDSPFLWYAVNPILLSATLLPFYFCWSMVAVFLTSASFLHRFNIHGMEGSSPLLWPDRAHMVLIFVLITLAAQLFNVLIKKLSRQADVMEEQVKHIKSLYEAIEVFSHHSNPKEIVSLFASYSRALTGALKVIVWIEAHPGTGATGGNFYAVRGPRDVLAEEDWYPYITELFENRLDGQEIYTRHFPAEISGVAGTLVTVKVKSRSNMYGLLSAFFEDTGKDLKGEKQTLSFLADLCAVALEKLYLESLAEEYLLVDEKDRIAGEIHDKVTQNLFGLVYGLDLLIKKNELEEPVCEQVRLLQKTAQASIKDLRSTIYTMSTLKNRSEPFVDEIKRYLQDLGKLNNVQVHFEYSGNFRSLNSVTRKSLTRIVREATGNAIRHGYCSSISVSLEEDGGALKLAVSDNGCGFDQPSVQERYRGGLGLLNMKELARNMGGSLNIESVPGQGTTILCQVPPAQTHHNSARGERVV